MRDIPVILSNADTVAHDLEGADLPIIILSRAEIESGLVGDALARLMAFSDMPENVRRFEGCMHLLVSGYDGDQRELFQIPQVCAFVRRITRLWPFWMHFLARTHDGLGVVLPLLLDMEVIAVGGGRVAMRMVDDDALLGLAEQLFAGMNTLHAFAGLGHDHTLRSSDAVNEHLSAWLGGGK